MTGLNDDLQAITAANQRFYDAHEARDIALMEAAWERSDRVVCVHPGWPMLRGYELVTESWRRIFAGPGRNQFILTNLAVVVEGDVGWVTVDENLMDQAQTGTIAATNMFVRADDHWLILLHHGSPVMT